MYADFNKCFLSKWSYDPHSDKRYLISNLLDFISAVQDMIHSYIISSIFVLTHQLNLTIIFGEKYRQ